MNVYKVSISVILTLAVCTARSGSENITVQDIDGNIYNAVRIGDQVWTVENLRTTKYNDGEPIRMAKSEFAWKKSKPGFCFYNNTTDADSIKKYGALYNWFAISTNKLPPKGWHVPTNDEWNYLEYYLEQNGYNWDGSGAGDNKFAKSMAAEKFWPKTNSLIGGIGNDSVKTRKCGFSALPGGFRFGGNGIGFENQGVCGRWWSVTEPSPSYAYGRMLYSGDVKLETRKYEKDWGLSVRLIKDK